MLCELPHEKRWQQLVALLVVSWSIFIKAIIVKYGDNNAIFRITTDAWMSLATDSYIAYTLHIVDGG